MSHAVSLILSLLGALGAVSSLAAGEALRTDEEPLRRRFTPRLLVTLALLASAVVAGALALLRGPAGGSPLPAASLLLLAAGTGATLWAYADGPRRRGDEPLGERLTPRGKLALGLLAGAQVLDLSSGRTLATIKEVQAPGNGAVSLLTVLGLVVLALGTAVAAVMFRVGSPLAPGPGPLVPRLSPLAKGTYLLLGLALAVVGLATLLAPEVGMLMCLLLLTLGTVSGLFALVMASKPGTRDEPAPWGISSRAWVSLALLVLACFVLGAREVNPLSASRNREGAAKQVKPAEQPALASAVTDQPSVWLLGSRPAVSGDPGAARELEALRNELREVKAWVLATRPATRSPTLTPARSEARVAEWPAPGAAESLVERKIAEMERKLDALAAQLRAGRPESQPRPAVSSAGRTWTHTSPFPVLDLSQGVRRPAGFR
jgi:hypothetical protein